VDLEDYANTGHIVDRHKLNDFDHEIMAANAARRRLAASVSDLAKKL